MKDKEKLTENVSTRITKRQKDQLDELDVNLREIIDYYIVHNTNPTMEMKNRQKRLLKEIKEMEKELSDKKEELKEINKKLGVPIDINNATLDVVTIAERIKDACQTENNGKIDEYTLANFIQTGRGKNIFNHGLAEYGINDDEKIKLFKTNLYKYLEIESVSFHK